MRGFTFKIKHSILKLATVLSALLAGVTFVLSTSVASVGEINKDVIARPKVDESVLLPVNQDVRPFAVRPGAFKPPFGFRPFGFIPGLGFRPVLGFNPNGFNPLFDEVIE